MQWRSMSSLWYSHTHIPKGYIEDWAKTWKITCFIHTHTTHILSGREWSEPLMSLLKTPKNVILTLATAGYYTWKYSLFWHEVYEALYDLVAGMSMLTVKHKSCSKNKQIMRLGQKLCFVFFLISFLQISYFLGYQYQLIV